MLHWLSPFRAIKFRVKCKHLNCVFITGIIYHCHLVRGEGDALDNSDREDDLKEQKRQIPVQDIQGGEQLFHSATPTPHQQEQLKINIQ